jgi:hypothetical protein
MTISFKHLQSKCIPESRTIDEINKLKELYVLSTLHTKQLLNLKELLIKVHCAGRTLGFYESWVKDTLYSGIWIRESLLRRELNRREHIPNKAESKQLRKQH